MHGGTNKGPLSGNRNALIHGNRSAEAEAQLKTIRATDRDLRLLTRLREGVPLRPHDADRVFQLVQVNLRLRAKDGEAESARCHLTVLAGS